MAPGIGQEVESAKSSQDTPSSHDHEHAGHAEHERGWEVADLYRVLFVAAAAAVVWFHLYPASVPLIWLGVAATLIGGYPIFREALENILERRMTMELSMTIALVAALAIREVFTALIITLFVLAAEILEGMTVSRGRKAIQDLLRFLPQTAEVDESDKFVEKPLAEVKKGDHLLVRPGAFVPVDGEVYRGFSFIDQSAITGEPVAVEKTKGDTVFAGTLNQTSVIEVVVSRIGAETAFGRIIEVVQNAERSRAPIQRIADQLAGYLVYFAMGAAVLTFFISHNVRSSISVIIVAGACGIAAGTPLAILGAIGRAAKAGAIVKGGVYIEQLGKVDTVVLDKTGTLTWGAPAVVDVRPAPGVSREELLRWAAIAERNSEHPLGRAIVAYAEQSVETIPSPSRFHYEPGSGITAQFAESEIIVGNYGYLIQQRISLPSQSNGHDKTEVLVALRRQYLGAILVDDRLRDEAVQAVHELKAMKIRTVMLSGDSAEAAGRVCRELLLDESLAPLLPGQKMTEVGKLQLTGRKVAMVDDGINDAPALSQADVGIAMGSGTDVARESADVVLIGNNLLKLTETLGLARRCRRIIFQNFYGTLAVDAAGVMLAAFGFLSPLLAAFIHVSSELAFILNSARLLSTNRN